MDQQNQTDTPENNKDVQTTSKTDKRPRKGHTNNPNGRPKGTGNKLSVKTLLKSVETVVGMTFEESLAQNYKNAIEAKDRPTILAYDRLLVNKVVADARPEDEAKEDNKPLPWNGD